MAIDLEELERLLAGATKGPWTVNRFPKDIDNPVLYVDSGEPIKEVCRLLNGFNEPKLEDASLIVAAVNALPSLIARIRELEAKADVVRNEESSLWWTAMCSLNCMTLAEWGQKRRDETVAAVKKAPDGGAIELEAKLAEEGK